MTDEIRRVTADAEREAWRTRLARGFRAYLVERLTIGAGLMISVLLLLHFWIRGESADTLLSWRNAAVIGLFLAVTALQCWWEWRRAERREQVATDSATGRSE